MIRTQIQLDESTWERLRQVAFERKSSIAAVIREMIKTQVSPKQKTRLRAEDFSFVGSGRSRGKGAGTVSERHDDEFADGIL
ncbi:MAG TPA: CopG family transcriptional regulator [Candidatus Paceibacterota bacterium]